MLKDLNDQIATLRDNISYVQDNINECQTSIVQMEENKVRIAYFVSIRTEKNDISSRRQKLPVNTYRLRASVRCCGLQRLSLCQW